MVRVIYLLKLKGHGERRRLILSTLNGEPWKVRTMEGKLRKVTDREMVDLAQQLQGWTRSVYKFGCAFIHLSDFHNHHVQNPFDRLPSQEKQSILDHMRHYHHGPLTDSLSVEELSMYIPAVFDKITSNLECYLEDLEHGKTADI